MSCTAQILHGGIAKLLGPWWRLSEVMDPEEKRRLDKLYVDMYEGADRENPSITTRITVLEVDISMLKTSLDKLNMNIVWTVRLLLGSLILAICNLAYQTVRH